ncbi:uncharacterized protein LY79DRAFT_146478 [Colletotrichum navitas]|uniref:Uncharacterized protein n=1 Tax=Colletotrichum navitas TaxID=681940 RepID=A0AAD8QBT1_9PEZI|nr:uncharacterized protein LY79DRAFT_146478 [Colletotrichum navitas]KAK1599647.1 hypothetical protein LY79DRAFT_146478 [Colletotrichum navitas]
MLVRRSLAGLTCWVHNRRCLGPFDTYRFAVTRYQAAAGAPTFQPASVPCPPTAKCTNRVTSHQRTRNAMHQSCRACPISMDHTFLRTALQRRCRHRNEWQGAAHKKRMKNSPEVLEVTPAPRSQLCIEDPASALHGFDPDTRCIALSLLSGPPLPAASSKWTSSYRTTRNMVAVLEQKLDRTEDSSTA